MDALPCLAREIDRGFLLPQDLIKHCYQAAFGGSHICADIARAKDCFFREFDAVTPSAEEPVTLLAGGHSARLSLAAWKAAGLPAPWLWRIFRLSAAMPQPGEALFFSLLEDADRLARQSGIEHWADALHAYRADGIHAPSHSETYRLHHRPSYRVISTRFLPLLPLLHALALLPTQEGVRVIAIDGRAASGKSTAAALLAPVLEAGVVHMDDFFLPPTLRTAERLATPGGNVEHERFAAEVLPQLRRAEGFSYRRFDCRSMALAEDRFVPAAPYRIVEGAYSHHPTFGDYADVRLFSDISPQQQRLRILERNGEAQLAVFLSRWIPMEEQYFAACSIRERADLLLRSDE